MAVGPVQKNVTIASAGSRVALYTASAVYAQSFYIEAHQDNLGSVYFGTSTVSTASYVSKLTAGQKGFSINAQPAAMVGTDGGLLDLTKLFVDASTAAQVVCVTYLPHLGTT